MFARTLDYRRAEVVEVFRCSETLMEKLLRHLGRGVVFQVLYEAAQDGHAELQEIAWHIFRAVTRFECSRRPRRLVFVDDFPIDFPVSGAAVLNGMTIIATLLGSGEVDDDFRELLVQFFLQAKLEALTSAHFDVLVALGPHAAMKEVAIGWLRTKLVRGAVAYLAVCAGLMEWWEVAGVAARVLLGGVVEQWMVLAVVQLVRNGVQGKEEVVGAIRQIVCRLWNEKKEKRLIRALCLQLQCAVGERGWVFPRKVLEAWGRDQNEYMETVPLIEGDWGIPEGQYDAAFVESLRQITKVEYVEIKAMRMCDDDSALDE
jgi:hypothetical protein